MKQLLLIVIALPALFSCTKHDTGNVDVLTGRWELYESVGGIAGTIGYPPGNGNTLLFKSDKSYTFMVNNGGVYTGTYELKASLAPGNLLLVTHYIANGQAGTQTDSINVTNNLLMYLPAISCCDIQSAVFRRLPF